MEPEEKPPMLADGKFRPVSPMIRVDIDQEDDGVYRHFEPTTSTTFYYWCSDPKSHELSEENIMYVYIIEGGKGAVIVTIDKYQWLYRRVVMDDLTDLTFAGQPPPMILRPRKPRVTMKEPVEKFTASMGTLRIRSDSKGKGKIHIER
ncbi:hypothetical protein GOP47_0021002, partial [Adiantum capillus-veneris]